MSGHELKTPLQPPERRSMERANADFPRIPPADITTLPPVPSDLPAECGLPLPLAKDPCELGED
jgi:hypothetical protein